MMVNQKELYKLYKLISIENNKISILYSLLKLSFQLVL